jgi:hypothetical protein
MSSRSEEGARCGHPRCFCNSQNHRARWAFGRSRPAHVPQPGTEHARWYPSPHECAPGEICHYQPRESRYSRLRFDNGRQRAVKLTILRMYACRGHVRCCSLLGTSARPRLQLRHTVSSGPHLRRGSIAPYVHGSGRRPIEEARRAPGPSAESLQRKNPRDASPARLDRQHHRVACPALNGAASPSAIKISPMLRPCDFRTPQLRATRHIRRPSIVVGHEQGTVE